MISFCNPSSQIVILSIFIDFRSIIEAWKSGRLSEEHVRKSYNPSLDLYTGRIKLSNGNFTKINLQRCPTKLIGMHTVLGFSGIPRSLLIIWMDSLETIRSYDFFHLDEMWGFCSFCYCSPAFMHSDLIRCKVLFHTSCIYWSLLYAHHMVNLEGYNRCWEESSGEQICVKYFIHV